MKCSTVVCSWFALGWDGMPIVTAPCRCRMAPLHHSESRKQMAVSWDGTKWRLTRKRECFSLSPCWGGRLWMQTEIKQNQSVPGWETFQHLKQTPRKEFLCWETWEGFYPSSCTSCPRARNYKKGNNVVSPTGLHKARKPCPSAHRSIEALTTRRQGSEIRSKPSPLPCLSSQSPPALRLWATKAGSLQCYDGNQRHIPNTHWCYRVYLGTKPKGSAITVAVVVLHFQAAERTAVQASLYSHVWRCTGPNTLHIWCRGAVKPQ